MANSLRPSTNNLRKLGNFSQMFRWGIKVTQWPNKMSQWANSSQDFNIRALSASVPEKTGSSTEVQIRGNKVRQPGIAEYTSPWSCTLMETNDTFVQKMLHDWHNLYWDTNREVPTGNSSGITQFKADLEGIIELYQLNNLDEPIYKYTLIGVYVEGYQRGDFDGSTADPMQPAISFAFDYFTEEAISAGLVFPSVYADGFTS